MWEAIKKFKDTPAQTKYFYLMLAIYMGALVWTTAQAYARLTYSRSDEQRPIEIRTD